MMPAGSQRGAKLPGVVTDEIVAADDRDHHCNSLESFAYTNMARTVAAKTHRTRIGTA